MPAHLRFLTDKWGFFVFQSGFSKLCFDQTFLRSSSDIQGCVLTGFGAEFSYVEGVRLM